MSATAGAVVAPRDAGLLRAGLVLLAVPQAVTGLWALFAPRSFHDDFPAIAGPWVSPYGGFDPHLTGDVGSSFLALAVLLFLAAIWLELRLVQATLIAWLVFSVPHLIFHITDPRGGDLWLSLLGLVGQVVGGAALFALTFKRSPSPG